MARVLLFNPENDVRLAEMPGRTPRKLTEYVRALGRDGALLPLWWADEGDYILVREGDRETVERKAEEMRSEFGLKANIVFTGEKVTGAAVGMPWGWSYDSANVLSSAGATCPDDEQIERIRLLSHRRTASEIARRLREGLNFDIPAPAVECRTMTVVQDFLKKHNGGYVKAPWSSSGRGVFNVDSLPDRFACTQIESIIKRQGSVMCETALTGVADFAMLFRAEGGMVAYKGLSVFDTNGGTAYSGNVVAKEDYLENLLKSKGADGGQLNGIRETLAEVLTDVTGPHYEGWLGVDMMLLADGSIAPCIELNLRITMGVVAKYLAKRIPAELLPGRYSVGRNGGDTGIISLTGRNDKATFVFGFGENS